MNSPYELRKKLVSVLQEKTGYDFGLLLERSAVPSLTGALDFFESKALRSTVEDDLNEDGGLRPPRRFKPELGKVYPALITEVEEAKSDVQKKNRVQALIRLKLDEGGVETWDNVHPHRWDQLGDIFDGSDLAGKRVGVVFGELGSSGKIGPVAYRAVDKQLTSIK
jgi:hypothetical protein